MCPVVSKSLFLELINNCQKFFPINGKAAYSLDELSSLRDFVVESENNDFFGLPYILDAFFNLKVKVTGPNHLSIVLVSNKIANTFAVSSCSFNNAIHQPKKRANKIRIIDEIDLADMRIRNNTIYYILMQLIALYLAQDKFNFLISENFTEYLEFKKLNFNVRLNFDAIPKQIISKSGDLWHMILNKIIDRCFSRSAGTHSLPSIFAGQVTEIILDIVPSLEINLRFCFSSSLAQQCLLNFKLKKTGEEFRVGIFLHDDFIKIDSYLRKEEISKYFEQDVEEILEMLGIINNEKEFKFLKRACRIYDVI